MIQNIEPHVYRNEYVPEPPKEDSVIYIMKVERSW